MNAVNPLLLDFQQPRRPASWVGLIMLATGFAITIFLSIQIFITQRNLSENETRYSIITRHASNTQHAVRLTASQMQNLKAEVRDANNVMLHLSLPWNDLFKEIAASQQHQVALLAIVPDASRRSIKISGEARNLDVLLAYLRKLQTSNSLHSVYLQKHKVETRDPQQPVRFTIDASWGSAK